MKALINFKICDNARECNGIEVCPTGAMHYDEEKKTIVVDENLCTCCGLCERNCTIGAILVPKSEEQYIKYQEQIEKDERKIKDLFVDRYGAASISEYCLIVDKQLDERTKKSGITFIEVFDSETSECLLKSIPIKEITDKIDGDVNYYKIDTSLEINTKYDIKDIPSLLIFKEGKLFGKIDGYYTIDERQDFEDKINKIIGLK